MTFARELLPSFERQTYCREKAMPEPAPEQEKKPASREQAPADLDELAAPQGTGDNRWDVVFTYTRAQALADGVLVDVTETAREAGFRYPVALTAALWADINDIPPQYEGIQDAEGRLWDVLRMARVAIRQSKQDGSELHYRLIMHVGDTAYYTVKLVVGPGDQGEPVITLMKEFED